MAAEDAFCGAAKQPHRRRRPSGMTSRIEGDMIGESFCHSFKVGRPDNHTYSADIRSHTGDQLGVKNRRRNKQKDCKGTVCDDKARKMELGSTVITRCMIRSCSFL